MSKTAATRGRRPRRRKDDDAHEGGRLVTATFEGKLLAALLAGFAVAALIMGEELVLLAGLMGLGVALASRLAVSRNLKGIEAARHVPPRARAGVPVRVSYALRRPGRTPALGVVLEDALGGPTRPRRVEISVPLVGEGRVLEHVQPVAFGRRGRFTLERPRVRSRFPLALFEARMRVGETAEILVRPREGRPTLLLRQALAGRTQAFHRPSLRSSGEDAFHGIRDYRDGDDPRRIHWRTTARRGTLTVAEWHREEGREVVVVLGRAAAPGPDTQADFERAVSTAATVLRLAARHGLRTRLVLGRPEEERRAPPAHPLRAALDALALVKGQGGRRPRSALRRWAGRPGSRIVVFVASSREAGIEERLRAAAGARGTPILLQANAPALGRWIRGLS